MSGCRYDVWVLLGEEDYPDPLVAAAVGGEDVLWEYAGVVVWVERIKYCAVFVL